MQLNTTAAKIALLIVWAALTVSCRGSGAIQISDFPDQFQTLPASLTIVNWNSQKGRHDRFAQDLQKLLAEEKPDIVFLQEAETGQFAPEQMGGYFAQGWHYPWPGGKTVGVVTLSRVPPVRMAPVPSRHREMGMIAPKVSLVTEYPLTSGQRLLAVNVHLLNFERWSVKKIRHQLEELHSIMSRHSGPILMVGDFNTWNQKRLDLVRRITRSVNLKEVIDFPQGRRTGDRQSQFWNEVLGIEKDLPLDRVFYSGFSPDAARVLDYDSSDHRPMLVKLTLHP